MVLDNYFCNLCQCPLVSRGHRSLDGVTLARKTNRTGAENQELVPCGGPTEGHIHLCLNCVMGLASVSEHLHKIAYETRKANVVSIANYKEGL